MITDVHREGRFYRLSTGGAAHYENFKPHNPSTEDWCIPADMEEGDYLMLDPACDVNEKSTSEKNAEEDWQEPEQKEVPKNLEPDLPFTIQTRQNDRTRSKKKYNPYGDDFVVNRIDLKKRVEEVVGLEVITVSQDIDIVDDQDEEWIEERLKPEVEFDDEQQQSYEQQLTNLRVLEWLNEMMSDPKETSVTIQDVDTGKDLCILVTRATEKRHVDLESLVLSLTRIRDFPVEREVKDLLLQVYDPN